MRAKKSLFPFIQYELFVAYFAFTNKSGARGPPSGQSRKCLVFISDNHFKRQANTVVMT